MKNYVYDECEEKSGYCKKVNPSYPVRNKNICGSDRDIGWIIRFKFEEPDDSNIKIEFGTDFGGGSAIWVDDVLDEAFQKDFWWGYNWSSQGVFRLDYDFKKGFHEVTIIGQEACCDGDMVVRFSKNSQPPEELTPENFDCQSQNKCPADCQSNQYQVGRECHNCSYKCAKCNKKPETCTECSSATREGVSQCNCKPKYYNIVNQAHCGACHSSCKSCSNGNSCDSCEQNQYLDGTCKSCTSRHGSLCGTCNKNSCITCKNNSSYTLPRCNNTSCYQNEFRVGQVCKPCHSSCKACVQSNQCTQCEANEYLKNGLCVSCESTYGNKCGTCNQYKCFTCKVNSAFKLPLCEKETCDIGQIADGTLCRNCETNCETCLVDTTTCTKCAAGSYLNNANCPLCQSPCQTCVNSATNCTSCVKNNYEISSGCFNCINRYFKTNSQECASCEEYYGQICGQCNKTECTECRNNPSFTLPTCTTTTCPQKYYKDGNICRACKPECTSCSNGTTCDQCKDLTYLGADKQCHACTGPCFLCSSQNVCTICKVIGRAPPDCSKCEGRYLMYENECIISCPSGWYADYLRNECRQCSSQCVECTKQSDTCTKCPTGKVLHEAKCVTCDEIKGFYQKPGAPEGTCLEKCGDGLRVSNQFACDDGNNIDGDGCSSKCEIEEGWICSGGSSSSPDICADKRPIKFSVDFFFDDLYLNVEENAPLKCLIKFSKQFTLPSGTSLKDFIVLKIAGRDTSGFKINIKERVGRRGLTSSNRGPEYDVTINSDLTLKKRELEIDLYPKSAFDDGNGNTLAESENPQKAPVKEYYYYNKQERQGTAYFEFWLQIGVLAMMVFLPFYVFYYKNHFNKFYALFFVIDITQLLYFYRFINIRWPINGIKFFRKLRPTISFYMWNFYKTDITSNQFSEYSSGVKKFDLEKESALFLNNVGSLLTLVIIFIGLYLFVVVLSQKQLYCKKKEESRIYKFFFHLRFGYFQWGIWFDSMLASSGVFIIYIFLQMTNANNGLNFFLAIGMAVFYFGFFLATLIYMKKNQNYLYNKEIDEIIEDMPLFEKMQKNPTFKLRNIWHFIHKLEDYPRKAYFYYFYVLRKIYLAIVLLTLQEHPTVQLSMIVFAHLVIILGQFKFTIFKERREKIRLILSEIFVLGGIGCMFFMLDDVSEDEHFRLKYSWFAIGSLLMGLFIHGAFFCYQEFIIPIIEYCLNRKKSKKVIDLRQYRKEGKQEATIIDDNSSYRFKSTVTSKFSTQKRKINHLNNETFYSSNNLNINGLHDQKNENSPSNSPKSTSSKDKISTVTDFFSVDDNLSHFSKSFQKNLALNETGQMSFTPSQSSQQKRKRQGKKNYSFNRRNSQTSGFSNVSNQKSIFSQQ